MKKPINLLILISLLAASALGCSNKDQPAIEIKPTPTVPAKIKPSFDQAQPFYGGILPYLPSLTRGTIKKVGSQIDISHLEWGLMELAQHEFSPQKYLFQEGQVISKKDLENLLNDNPSLVHVLEHDFLQLESGERAGIALALSLHPRYKDQDGQNHLYREEELRAKGKQMGEQVIGITRKLEPDIPILISIYVTEPGASLIPGHFLLSGKVKHGEKHAATWEPIDEQYFLLPGNEIKKADPVLGTSFKEFQKKLQSFFHNYVGITGLAKIVNHHLMELTLTANAEYDSRTEVIQFTQYAASLIPQYFSSTAHINLYVETIDRPLAIYIRPPKGEPIFHVYRK